MSGVGGEGGLALGPQLSELLQLEMADAGALEEGKSFCPEMSQCSKLLDQKLFCDPDKSQEDLISRKPESVIFWKQDE